MLRLLRGPTLLVACTLIASVGCRASEHAADAGDGPPATDTRAPAACKVPMGSCGGGVCDTDLARDSANCGVCNTSCAGRCDDGECAASRQRRHRLTMAAGEACVIRAGQVWCWPFDALRPVDTPTLVYGDDAEQVVLHEWDYAILRRDGVVVFEPRGDPAQRPSPPQWSEPTWSGVRDLAGSQGFLLAQAEGGALLWHVSSVSNAVIDNPPKHVRRVGGSDGGPCWQVIGAELWCIGGATAFIESPVALRDWSIDKRGVGIDGSGQVVGLQGTAAPVPLGITGAVQVASNLTMHCALLDDAHVRCFKGNTKDALTDLGLVAGIGDAVAIAAGGYAACALRAGDRVSCWPATDLQSVADVPSP